MLSKGHSFKDERSRANKDASCQPSSSKNFFTFYHVSNLFMIFYTETETECVLEMSERELASTGKAEERRRMSDKLWEWISERRRNAAIWDNATSV